MRPFQIKTILTFALMLTNLAFSAEIPVYFQKTNPPVPVFIPPAKSQLELANQAFLAKYGVEQGLLGTASGPREELVILVSDMGYATGLWNKMVAARDGYNTSTGGVFHYGEPVSQNPLVTYQFLGRINIPESGTAHFSLPYSSPSVSRFMVSMDSQCVLAKASVLTSGNVPVQATQLVASHKVGLTGIAYEHTVNGGFGANLTSIMVTLGTKTIPGPGFLVCPVDVFIQK